MAIRYALFVILSQLKCMLATPVKRGARGKAKVRMKNEEVPFCVKVSRFTQFGGFEIESAQIALLI